MNQEQMMAAFIQWLPTKVKELQNKSPEEIVNFLNQLNKENPDQAKALVEAFQAEVSGQAGMFKAGGKMNAFVKRFQPGGQTDKVAKAKAEAQKVVNLMNSGDPNTVTEVIKTKTPNDVTIIRKALRNRAGDRTIDGKVSSLDIATTTKMVGDSLLRRGYNPDIVRREALPILIDAELNPDKNPPINSETQRQINLSYWLRPMEGGISNPFYSNYRKEGGIISDNYRNPFTKSNTLENFLKTKK